MSEEPRYNVLDPDVERRADELLKQMTLQEKVGQLVQRSPFGSVDWGVAIQKMALADEQGRLFDFDAELPEAFKSILREGRIGTVMCTDLRITNYLQKLAVESRLHIPLLVAADVIHGFRTIFPIPLAQACTWDPGRIEAAERIAAEEASASGINWIFSPMVDIARDPRWGRIAEGAGEDPFLGAAVARARVRGFQAADLKSGKRIAACPKHYAGYGAAEAGRDYNTAELSERTLREVYLPPFKSAFEAGAGSTMSAFNDIGGVPASGNPFLLRTILRDEWQWPGVVVSDYNAIGELVNHGVAADLKDAARLAILSGVDIDMESGAYADHLAELVEAGIVPVDLVDQAVRRVLRLKLRLGLFEHPFVDESLADRILLNEDFRACALEVARESMVLLKNDSDLLPLQPGAQRVALIGPLADDRRDLLGTWAGEGRAEDVESIVRGIRTYLPTFTMEQGCSLNGREGEDFSAAVEAARGADAVILAVGEGADMSGEAHSRAHLGLPGRQQELLDALAETGKPIVAVLACGRPLVVPRMLEQVAALLVAWHGGIRAGQAIADILFGSYNPSGKLAVNWPRAEGQIPVYYAHTSTGRPAEGKGTIQFHEPFRSTYLDEANSPAFPFGFGLSYSDYEYSELKVETPTIPLDGTFSVSVLVRNTGRRAGTEIIQLYIRDLVASVTRPVKELKGFKRVRLEPGEAQRVCFAVPVHALGFINPGMQYIVEPGLFNVWLGPDSERGLVGEFEVRV